MFPNSTRYPGPNGSNPIRVKKPLTPPNNSYDQRFTVCMSNLRSIMNKQNYVANYLQCNQNVNLFFVTETWMKPEFADSIICPKDFNVYRADRVNAKGGGVLALFKKDLNVRQVTVPNLTTENFELLCVDLFIEKSQSRFICVYIPPLYSSDLSVITNLCKILSNLSNTSRRIFILGDFNLPNINWKTMDEGSNSEKGPVKAHEYFVQYCLKNCLQQFVSEPTHIKGNILDILLCNPPARDLLLNVDVNPPLSTSCDHNLISFSLQTSHADVHKSNSYPNFRKGDYDRIQYSFNRINWSNFLSTDVNVQSSYNNFITFLQSSIRENIPNVSPRRSKNKIPKHLKILLKDKIDLYRKSKSDSSLKYDYKKKSKEYDTAVLKWHDEIESGICNSPSNNKFYSFVNSRLHAKPSFPPLTDGNGKLIFTDAEKVNTFNKYFQNVFTQDDGRPPQLSKKKTETMPSFTITKEDILNAVKNMKDKISRSPEDIPIYFIKRTISSYLPFLVTLFNNILKTNVIPTQWKSSLITPVHKKGDRCNPNNYRPISLTSSFSRIFESILYSKIFNHLSSNSLLSPHQFGFLPSRSSCSQLLSCISSWFHSLSRNKPTHVIYTDISKAFDSVSHTKLLLVLDSYGLHPTVINWIGNFLSDRNQQVIINDQLSSPLTVFSGVPQGSIIGPLLFLIYINDIAEFGNSLGENGGISLFADDTKVYSHDPQKLQPALDRVTTWLKSRQLQLAPHKCFSLTINTGRSDTVTQPPTFSINNCTVSQASTMRDLGITISSDLKWCSHVKNITKNASFSSHQLLKSIRTRNIWTLLKLYKTYIRPKLEYNTPVWSPYLTKDIDKIEGVQIRFTKYIFRRCGIPFSSYEDRLYKLNIKSLKHRRIIYDLILIYKIINNISDIKFSDHFVYRSNPYNLRGNQMKIDTISKQNSDQWRNSFYNRAVKYWNALPGPVASSPSLQIFKTKIGSINLNSLTK